MCGACRRRSGKRPPGGGSRAIDGYGRAEQPSASTRMDPAIRELLQGPNFGHLATLMARGARHSVALWVTVVDVDRLAFVADPRSLKGRNIARDPRVALSIVDQEDPYRTAQRWGRVVANPYRRRGLGSPGRDSPPVYRRRLPGARQRPVRGRDLLGSVHRPLHATRSRR